MSDESLGGFPELPHLETEISTSMGVVQAAYASIQLRHSQALRLLHLDNGDLARLKVLKSTIETESLVVLWDLSSCGLPWSFIEEIMDVLVAAVVKLEAAIHRLSERYVSIS